MRSHVDIACFECVQEVPLVDADAGDFYCQSCGRDYRFVLCTACESVNQIRSKGDRGALLCAWCESDLRNRGFGRREPATAGDWYAELDERGLSHVGADDVVLGGFTLLGGSGFDVEAGAVCSVLTLPDGVDVRAEVGGVGVVTIPYGAMTGLDVADGTTTKGGRFVGGGIGVAGVVEGLLVASILNTITRKTRINTGLAVASIEGELLLNHDRISHDELRRYLSPLFHRFSAAQHTSGRARAADDPLTQLERLAQLHEKGLLTDSEFEAARSRQVKRLTDDAS